jgi:thiamine biosynthesis lipoprotein
MTATATWSAWSCKVRLVVEDDAVLAAASSELVRLLDQVDRAANRFRPDSALSKANTLHGRPVPVPRILTELVQAALAAARDTNGAVDPTVGGSLLAWGYDRDISQVAPTGPAVTAPGTVAGWQRVRLDVSAGLLTVPAGGMLDLGATAKSFTADLAARNLAARFLTPVLVELGGDLAVAGHRPGGWPIQVAEREGADGQTIVLQHGGLATSTTTIRRWRRGGQRVHHIIDPRTGAPAAGPWRTVTVAGSSAVAANTASTAAIVLGARAPDWLRERGLAARLVDNDGEVSTIGDWPTATAVAAA